MDIHHIEYFLQLKKYEHVSSAADFLNISQPSLSKSLATLEAELGVKLFDRVGRHVKLNKNGEAFAKYAEQALQLLNIGKLSAQSMCFETTGNISILCYAYAPIIVPCMNAYRELNPYTTFSVNQFYFQGDSNNMENPDFMLRSSRDEPIRPMREHVWVAQPLFREEYLLVSSPDYRPVNWEAYGDKLDLADLKEAFFVTMVQNELFFSDVTYDLCQSAGFYPQIYGKTDDFLVKMKMVDSGRAVALIPESCLRDAEMLCPGLLHFHLEKDSGKRNVLLMYPKKGMMTEAAKDFLDFALDYYEIPAAPTE